MNLVVRLGHWKGIWNADLDTFELYDLRADPEELTDVQGENPRVVEAMRDYARVWYDGCEECPERPEQVGELSEETLRTLRSLGYVD